MGEQVVVVTDALGGVGRLSAEGLALAGHTVYASMRDIHGRNASQAESVNYFANDNGVDLRMVEMDIQSQSSVDAAIERVFNANGRLDVVMHTAGRMAFGPAEAFTPQQLTELYDINVVGTQRVNRSVLPHMRRQRQGLVVWISSSSSAGGTPYLAPCLAAKAAMDALAVAYARELARWGIETSIIVPGAFTTGTNHFARAGSPADQAVVDEYEAGPYAGFGPQVERAFGDIVPPDADASAVADAVVDVVDSPFGRRPFRVHIDPAGDGADIGFAVLDRLRAEMLHRVGLQDLLKPARLV
ncbi:oxidoreductase [Mycobacterium alsense]|uniref:Oxidoreductase n=1 Tax=Mycobacterium alsense TaxID=324058 RepID=A0AA42BY38_9MYCO|nr:SDR family NAD(P)-dependent oxidoreductase [Mycobacterium alsense]MCV7379180.1 SDR family NAD(P)-dependent oxidoreductase [Mycobacterium alsense]OQZ89852.1 oxidoreductase [Mycobacterium alsense]